jgi:molecular chaperone DnaK
MQASMKLGEAIYGADKGAGGGGDASGGGAGGGSSAGARGKGDDNVVDADFEEVRDDKKKSA